MNKKIIQDIVTIFFQLLALFSTVGLAVYNMQLAAILLSLAAIVAYCLYRLSK